MRRYTVLGSSGFIGTHLASYLCALGHDVQTPPRDIRFGGLKDLGHVMYCIGLTADFRTRPNDTVDAHSTRVNELLRTNEFESITYLSSTRLYQNLSSELIASEDLDLPVNSNNPSDLYNISKLMGESLCLTHPNPKVRVVRLSNVVGVDIESNNFLTALIREAVSKKSVMLHTTLDSSKDYISIEDVVSLLPLVATHGRHRLYNIAAGTNISNKQIVLMIKKLVRFRLSVSEEAVRHIHPHIDVRRIVNEFNYEPRTILNVLENLVAAIRK